MVSKCANPDCTEPFHYLRDGKLFRIELDGTSPPPGDSGKPSHHVEHFWLCGRCASDLTLVSDKERGVIAIPLVRMPRAS